MLVTVRAGIGALRMRIGVVADDITGANDIGIMFRNGGCVTNVYSLITDRGDFMDFTSYPADVVVLDTNSRLDSVEMAYQKVFNATQLLKQAGCKQFYNKTCSVFRGNIGAEFDAMLDVLEEDFAVVVLGFPKNGRITRGGIHYVHGKLLAESEFQFDPIHPMRESNLVKILQSQTKRKVGLLPFETIDRGAQPLREVIQQKRAECNYLILDVLDQEALTTIAAAVKEETILCGSSALGETLPRAWDFQSTLTQRHPDCIDSSKGILITAGSLTPQTAAQIEYFYQLGHEVLSLEPHHLFDGRDELYFVKLVNQLSDLINQGQDVVLHSEYQLSQVERTRQMGKERGLSRVEISRVISGSLAEITQRVLEKTGQQGLIVAGGETSAAVCQKMHLFGFQVVAEIEPGLPSCVSLSAPPYVLVLKSGSFGKPTFFQKAINHLRKL